MTQKMLLKHWNDLAKNRYGNKEANMKMFTRKGMLQEMVDAMNDLKSFDFNTTDNAMKVVNMEDKLLVHLELAGYKKNDVSVMLLRGEEFEIKASNSFGVKKKSLSINNDGMDLDNISASMQDGLLTIEIPYKSKAKKVTRSIEIK